MKVDPINTILDNTVDVVKINSPSKCVLIGEELERGEINAGGIGQVLSVDTKGPIKVVTKGVGLAFTDCIGGISVEIRVNTCE